MHMAGGRRLDKMHRSRQRSIDVCAEKHWVIGLAQLFPSLPLLVYSIIPRNFVYILKRLLIILAVILHINIKFHVEINICGRYLRLQWHQYI